MQKNKKKQLPHITNDAQMSLILALGLTVFPHIARLPVWITLFASATLVYKLATLRYPRLAPPRLLVTLISFGMFAAVGLHYSTLFGRDAGVSLLVGMLFLKLFETRNYRDAMVMLSMSYFVIITNFFYTQTIPTAVYMFFIVAYITLAIINLNAGPAVIPWREKMRLTVPLTIFALPLMVLLFVLFPRIPGPLWGLPQDVYSAKSGLNGTMAPGLISQLALSDEVAFRVKFTSAPPEKERLYWRAIVMENFDGRTWRPVENPNAVPYPTISFQGNPINYTVTIEPHFQRWLFALDLAEPTPNTRLQNGNHMVFTSAAQVMASNPVINLTQYTLNSYTNYQLGAELSESRVSELTHLPGYNPQSVALAQSWKKQQKSTSEIIVEALKLFNNEFIYTLRPPILGKHTVDEFLFKTKRGFCEHFSSAFVVLMRAAGIPARIVTGYQGGEINPLGDYMVVRQADAHAWSEVWFEDRGWVRVDPTSAVSPARIEYNLDQAIPANENPRLLLRRHSELLAKLNLVWDSINNSWNEWILGYGPEMQQLFLTYLGIQNTAAYNLVLLLTFSLFVCIAVIAYFSFRRAKRQRADKVHNLYLKLCKKLSKAGYIRPLHTGPWDYLKLIRKENPRLAAKLKPIILIYIALRYRAERSSDSFRRLQYLVRSLRVNEFQKSQQKSAFTSSGLF